MGYPNPCKGASLMLSFSLVGKTVIVLGGSWLAASRVFAALEADSSVIVLVEGGYESACDELKWRVDNGQITIHDSCGEDLDGHLKAQNVSFAIMTDTLIGTGKRSRASARHIYHICRANNVLVNVADMPELCDFTFPSMHRFKNPSTEQGTPLQIGISTNGQGCRLAGRIRRDIVSKLPASVGVAVERVGRMRSLAGRTAGRPAEDGLEFRDGPEDANDEVVEPTPNRPVPMRNMTETALDQRKRRMKWVAQISEYWSLNRLAGLTDDEINEVLFGNVQTFSAASHISLPSIHDLDIPKPPGRILLVGSGPGHPSLLTVATHTALTKLADIVLTDKLVPSEVLALIPSTVRIQVARKFPGNADGAQNEMMEAAVEAAKKGLTVVRLKQGDPSVYGRAGEEILYFRSHGFEPLVIPGVSSALAAPTFANIPVTQRGVAESLIVCTGVGRKGKEVTLPGYERSRTLVVLMGVARIASVVSALTGVEEEARGRRGGKAYPSHTPIAIIERASMPDQRAIVSTLKDVEKALESSGEQRPPGMFVVGWSVLALWGTGDVTVLENEAEDEALDKRRVHRWLEDRSWRVEEGINSDWDGLL